MRGELGEEVTVILEIIFILEMLGMIMLEIVPLVAMGMVGVRWAGNG
jgi:hypothetical protein